MIRLKLKCMWCDNKLSKDGECNYCGNPQSGPLAKRYMMVQLRFDPESFHELKELLRGVSSFQASPAASSFVLGGVRDASEEAPSPRRKREALERVFKQIRDVEYSDG